MTNRIQILVILAVAVFGAGVLGGTAVSNLKNKKLEQRIEAAAADAAAMERKALEKERDAEQFRAKIAFLEQNLSEIKELARIQDDDIEKLSKTTGGLRDDVRRVRGIRRIESTIDGLCSKLDATGHPCE